jgi:hypothetical protein
VLKCLIVRLSKNIEVKINSARYNVINGLVDEDDFQSENFGKTAEEITVEKDG